MRWMILATTILLTGCGFLIQSIGEEFGYSISARRVVAKREPNELIAFDGSMCTVSLDLFDRSRIGDSIVCDWRGGPADRDTVWTPRPGVAGIGPGQ